MEAAAEAGQANKPCTEICAAAGTRRAGLRCLDGRPDRVCGSGLTESAQAGVARRCRPCGRIGSRAAEAAYTAAAAAVLR